VDRLLRHTEQDRACKPSTMQDYRNSVAHVFNPVFGERRVRTSRRATSSAHAARARSAETVPGPSRYRR
jgi:hypothetical protein